jgi:citrate lyase beta subunit
MTTLNRRRNWLFSPATKPDRFDRAASAGADVLTPSAEAVAEAQRILEENAKGVGVVGGRMVDEAVHARHVEFLPPPAHWFLNERRMRGLNASKPML